MKTTAKAVPAPTTSDIAATLKKAGMELFRERSGMPLNQAQRNLAGRTHYVDDSTLKSFVAKIHQVSIMDDGLILGMVESVQAGPNDDSGRVFRPVFFDVFGNVVHRPDIDESFPNQKEAMADFWKQAGEIDAVKAIQQGALAKLNELKAQIEEFEEIVQAIE